MSISAALAPFIVWLASRERDEALRRLYREHVERFLIWVEQRDGADAVASPDAPGLHDGRFEDYLRQRVTADDRRAARAALARFAEYRTIRARTAIIPG